MDRQFVNDRFLKQNSAITLLSFSRWIVVSIILFFLLWKVYLILFEPNLIDYLTPVFIGLVIGSLTYHIFFVVTRRIYRVNLVDNPNNTLLDYFDCPNCGNHLPHIVPKQCNHCEENIKQIEVQQMINAYYLTEEDLINLSFIIAGGLFISTIAGMLIWNVSNIFQSTLVINIPMMLLFVGLGFYYKLDQADYFPNNHYKKSVF